MRKRKVKKTNLSKRRDPSWYLLSVLQRRDRMVQSAKTYRRKPKHTKKED